MPSERIHLESMVALRSGLFTPYYCFEARRVCRETAIVTRIGDKSRLLGMIERFPRIQRGDVKASKVENLATTATLVVSDVLERTRNRTAKLPEA